MLSTRFKQEDSLIEIGIDEAGRGSFWGPIMAGALIIPPQTEWSDKQKELFEQLRDSKKITPKKREILYDLINEHVPFKGVGIVYTNEINEHGISWANQEAFRRAIHNIKDIPELEKYRLIIDGVLPISDWKGEQQLIVDGDEKYIAIAGASILAKVAHDKWIQEYCNENTECAERYDLLRSKGYGTVKHREGLKQYGGHELHRSMYIQNWLPGNETIVKKRTKKSKREKDTANLNEKCLIKFS